MAPTKHPSAWRLNKAEEKAVDSDLALWEANLPEGLSEEEKVLKRQEERKRLVRVIQEAKHEASLQKQQTAGAKSKAAASQKASASKPASGPPTVSASGVDANSEYYEQVKQDMAVIDKVLGSNLKELLPTPIAAMDEYKLDKAKVALEAHGSYICSCNLYWLDSWKSPAPGVPLSRARVQQLADFYFPEDRNNNFFLKLLEVQVDVGSLTDKPAGLVVISPLEIVHAVYLKAAQELGQSGVTAACKTAWKEALTFVLMEKVEGRKLTEAEVAQLLKNKHLLTAQRGAGQSAVDESIRARKKKVRGFSYSQRLELSLFSDKPLSVVLPEKPRQVYSGFSSGDAIGFVTALPTSQKEKVDILSAKRTLTVEGTKEEDQETCFSCTLAPPELYAELLHSYCAACVVDASPGQGELLKAALTSRTKAVAICGTESHAARLELLLTDFVLGELTREGSTFYRPDSVSKDGDEEDKTEAPQKVETKKQAKTRKAENEGAAPKKKQRKPSAAAAEEAGEETTEKPPKKTKKPKKEAEEDEGDEESSELWA
eukprot:Skav230600  [mRNA]  locus=scaffold168:96734:100132:- [translate_table: standard]